jgi:hypothetical protein
MSERNTRNFGDLIKLNASKAYGQGKRTNLDKMKY